jgi:hypothetical protein
MSDEIVTLLCPKCGAGLDIYADTQNLACHQCELKIQVSRRGGTIELNGSKSREMEVRPWPDLISADATAVRTEDALLNLRSAKQQLVDHVRRRRTLFFSANAAVASLVLLAGAWIVRDKDSHSQLALGVLLVGGLALASMGGYLGRNGPMRYRWSREWPWSWQPGPEESSRMQHLNDEIARLEKLLAEKKA